ncbi:class I SAM-dependent methyltransferase [Bradyrhizobium diazoefficiens]|nr:class I SAM-dependent methyltransferase [Bradyrhizobium diazoefficiens]MBR0964773.1 class I SAM-dependent methyltransferase [Bradyrhizobium diazoefficiens]MBR0978946.1 class I SAM-dependent methyltransferase [Bradyrhizobium diazoefficiens]MBR1006760.1 class I SAM-dependent methyltransferase [Bradyrhizobium diazoefficiens]MBR1014384.1 class I SAM-dependent methyltransferase [Bradyrhizobium diazoefficiens]MBR1051941.1 class I SAM-dependent methyltransferase [Bradyrhizobium diazoefficiens]
MLEPLLDRLRQTALFATAADIARQTMPPTVLMWLRTQMVRNLRGTPNEVFSEIYRRNIWGYKETASGAGSTLHNTQRVRESLPGLIRDLKIKTLLDLPCGDLHWLSKIELPISHYIGGDIVPELVKRTAEKYSRPDRSFLQIDLCKDPLPEADLLLCRDCFIHLSEDMIFRAIENILRSNIKYLLTTTFPGGLNRAISTGDFFTIDLCAPPYNFPAPIRVLEDWVPPFDRRQLALWEVESLKTIDIK